MVPALRFLRQIDRPRLPIMAWDSPPFPHPRLANKDTEDIQATSNSNMRFMVARATTSTAAWVVIKLQLDKVIKVAHTANIRASVVETITPVMASSVVDGVETTDINGIH